MCGTKCGPKWEKPLRIEKSRNGQVRNPKLNDNARQLSGIYFIDPNDQEYQENMKNARRRLETKEESPFATLKNAELEPKF